ncbi:hypothetical protein MTsPCn9_33130 [Croceitalea sp. MTPC9]|uniref:GIN domain-containing protein n=1 Tax=unclassified Croceitalea TaxID=2632280 RepID=UPI002B368BD1|nr:hypothetical protein MTsPCn6_33430 [Croceitalea sp. MTPC6]GMN18373.1 hypothetical protein MTsPCn9_33130 [Croceitalea sp. MTPC9]
MKKLIFLFILCIPFLSIAQRKPKIKGNRSVTEVREDLPAFNAVELNDNLDIQLKKSFGEGYEITADDNLIDVLKFKVEDSTLVISTFYDITSKKKLEITVNYNELKAITQRDGKIMVMDVLSTDNLYVNTFGPSKLNLKASAFIANLNMEDTSEGDFNLDVDSLNVSLKHRSDASIYSVSSAKSIELLNTASLDIEGTTDTLSLKMYNNTKFVGQRLEAGTAKIQVEESASVRINAFRELELKSRDNSKTYLYGEPKITILEFLDTSQLIKKEN